MHACWDQECELPCNNLQQPVSPVMSSVSQPQDCFSQRAKDSYCGVQNASLAQGSRAGAKSRHAAKQPQSPPKSIAKATPSAQQQPAAVTLSKAEKRRLARDQQHAASEQQERRAKRNMLLRYVAFCILTKLYDSAASAARMHMLAWGMLAASW